jgi:hypothetical protein
VSAPTLDPGLGLSPVDFDEIGPPIGQRFPDVVLPDQTGRAVDLHTDRAGRPALVVVHRSADW